MKAICVRLDEDLEKEFTEVCRTTGHKKNTVISRLIQAYVRSQLASGSQQKQLKRRRDPFANAIGLLDLEPLAVSDEEIDRVVYNL